MHAALRRSPIALHVQRLVPLTKGSQLRRYEVLLRSKSEHDAAPHAMLKTAVDSGLGSMIDRRVVTELMQDDFTGAAVAAEVRRLLESSAAREEMKAALAQVRASLGSSGAIERAADVFARMIQQP